MFFQSSSLPSIQSFQLSIAVGKKNKAHENDKLQQQLIEIHKSYT